jgi:hypothetical protein
MVMLFESAVGGNSGQAGAQHGVTMKCMGVTEVANGRVLSQWWLSESRYFCCCCSSMMMMIR